MTQQPNALAAITAALTGGKPPVPATTPAPFGTQPPVVNPATLPVQTTPFAVASNPFQPTPVQAQAAFAAAVPQAAVQHAHPVTGVPFAPINPPDEATSAPTVGLDAAPVQTQQTVVAPAEAPPKATRARKPRAAAASADAIAGVPLSAGDGAAQPAAASALPSGDGRVFGSPRDARPSSQDLADFDQALNNTSTEVLVQELAERGWTVTLAK